MAQDRISLDLNGMDIVEVVRTLGGKAGISFVIDKNVSGRATVVLKDVTPIEALDAILASNGLARDGKNPVQRIMTVQDREVLEAANVSLEMRGFSLGHVAASKAAEAVRDILTRGAGRVTVDERTNKIVVRDSSEVLARVGSFLKELDVPAREVAIDAKIVQVNLGDKTSLGIDWEYVLNEKVKVAGMFGRAISSTGNLWTIGHAALTEANDYKAVIEALRTQGETRILSSPRLTVADREAAKILVGSKQVYVTTSAVQSTTTTETTEAVNFVDVGVKLFVTPTIGTDGLVSLKIRPEVSSVVETYRTAAGNAIPVVETSEAETTVVVPDGETVVIAGLMKDETINAIYKIPFFGDIPFLGAFFRRSVRETRKTELAVFLTCRALVWEEGVKK